LKLALLQLRNEARFLGGCLDHLRRFVDGFVALDDGSTDATGQILEREPMLRRLLRNPPAPDHRWDERANRGALLRVAKDLGARWVVCCDADERFETRFLGELGTLTAQAERQGKSVIATFLRELYDAPDRYRVDGIWGKKVQLRVFRVPDDLALQPSELHGSWVPSSIRRIENVVPPRYSLYHLRMIRQMDREARRDRYEALDPTHASQPMGYAYLADDEGAAVERILPGAEYAIETLPPDLREYCGPRAS
jgi:glycosyltransferase involved in cell wall biosynthesis